MALRFALLRSVRRSVFAHVSSCKLHARALPATSPKRLMTAFNRAAVDDGVNGTQQVFQLMRVCYNGLYGETPAKRVELAEKMFSIVNERGLNFGVEFHNLLLQVYRQNRHPFSQTEFLETMREKGVAPNRGTLLLLLESYCQQGNMDGAMKVLEELKTLDIAISEKTYAALISGYCETGNLTAACGLLDVMTSNGLNPGFVAYTALVAGHAYQAEMEKMKEILADMKAQKIYPGMHVYMTIIDSLSRGGHVQQIPEILELIKDKPLVNNEIADMCRVLAGRGEFESSLLLLRFLSQLSAPSETGHLLKPGENLFKHMASSDLPLESLWPVMEELKSMDIPVAHMYDRLLFFSCYQKNRPNLVPEVIRRMHAEGVPVHRHYMYPMFVLAKGDLKLVTEGIELLQVLKAEIDSQTLHFIRIGTEDKFPSTFPVLKDVGLLNTRNTFTAVRAMLTSNYLRPYLGSFLSILDDAVNAGMVCSLIINGVRENQLSTQTLLEVFAVLGSWENKVVRDVLLDRIARVMLEDNRIEQLLTLVSKLLEKDRGIVCVSTTHPLLKALTQKGMKEEHESFLKLLREKNFSLGTENTDFGALKEAIVTENIPGILAAFERYKEEAPKAKLLNISLQVIKLFCSNPDYFSSLPRLLTLLNHDVIPMGMLCSPIINAVRRPGLDLGMQDMVEVLRILGSLRPAKALTELVDRITFSLSTQKKPNEILVLMQPLVKEKIVDVASGALISTFNILLNSRMIAESLDFAKLLKERGIPYEQVYLPICTKVGLEEENIGMVLDALSVTQVKGKPPCDTYPVLKLLLCEKHFHYLLQVLSNLDKRSVAPGLLCAMISNCVTTDNIPTRDVIEVIKCLKSWEPDLFRQELVHRIIGIYCEQEKFEEVIALIRPLVEEKVIGLAYKTVRRVLKTLSETQWATDNKDLMEKLEQLEQEAVDFDMIGMIDGDVEIALQSWDKLKLCENSSHHECTIRMCRRLCADPKLCVHLPEFLSVADHSFIHPDLLGSQLSHSITNKPILDNLDNTLKVLSVLRDWEPNFSRELLLSSIVSTLSRQERVIEVWTLVKSVMTKEIMPVSMHVLELALANLTRKRMNTEQSNLFEMMKEKGMEFDRDWMLLRAATRVGDIDVAENSFKALQEVGKADAGACSMVLHLLCKKRWDMSAQRFYLGVVENGLHPDKPSSCELINRMLRSNNMDFANDIRRNMQEHGLSLNMLGYNAYVFAHARQGNVDAVKQTLQEITKANLTPSAVSVKGLLTAYNTNGDRDGMLLVQDYLKETSCSTSQFDTNMLHVLQNSNAKPYLFSGFPGPETS